MQPIKNILKYEAMLYYEARICLLLFYIRSVFMNPIKKYIAYYAWVLILSTSILIGQNNQERSFLDRYGEAAIFGIVPSAPPTKLLHDLLEKNFPDYTTLNLSLSGLTGLVLTNGLIKLACSWEDFGVKRPFLYLSISGITFSVSIEALKHVYEIATRAKVSMQLENSYLEETSKSNN